MRGGIRICKVKQLAHFRKHNYASLQRKDRVGQTISTGAEAADGAYVLAA